MASLSDTAQNRLSRLCRKSLLLWAVIAFAAACAYPQEFDLSKLPSYKPSRADPTSHCHNDKCNGEWGVIRIHGIELNQALIGRWQNGFLKLHPNIRFSDYFVPNGFAGLTVGTHDLSVIGHSIWRSDFKAFQGVYGYAPLEIMFATGGFNKRTGNTPAPIFIVNQANPISRLTLKQLDGIFGAERSGGWTPGYVWSTASARSARENIRTWGELGLTGEWADQPIHPFGFDATLSNWSELIQRVVFKGGDKWNPALQEMVRGGFKAPADKQIVDAVAADRYAIGFNLMRVIETEPKVKALALAAEGGPYTQPTAESLYQRTYPLSSAIYLYVNRPPGQPLTPRLKEFLTYVLSRQGQQDVVDDGMYIPLNPEAAREQLKKLE